MLAVKEPCGANAAAVVASVTGAKNAPALKACATSDGFRSVKLTVLGKRRLRLGFSRLVANPVTVDVFQTSSGTRSLSNRRVARLTKLGRSQTFAPKKLADGYYFVRYQIKGARKRTDERRLAFRVREGADQPASLALRAELVRPAELGEARQPRSSAGVRSSRSASRCGWRG